MSITNVIIYAVAAFGLAYILGHAVISQGAREALWERGNAARAIVMLLECPACCGFWIGLIVGAMDFVFYDVHDMARRGFLAACFTAGSNFILGRLTKLVGHPRGE